MRLKDAMYILGIKNASDITEEIIKNNYNKLAKKFHPDISKEPDANERFQEINKAQKFLKDYIKRNKNKSKDADINAFDKKTLLTILDNILNDFEKEYNGFSILLKDDITKLIDAMVKRYENQIDFALYVTKSDLEEYMEAFNLRLTILIPKYENFIKNKSDRISELKSLTNDIPSKYSDVIKIYNDKISDLSNIFDLDLFDKEYHLIFAKIKNIKRIIEEKQTQEALENKVYAAKKAIEKQFVKYTITYPDDDLDNAIKYSSMYANLMNYLKLVNEKKRPEQKLEYYDSITFNEKAKDIKISDYILGKYKNSEKLITPKFIDEDEAIALGSILYPIINYKGKIYKLRPLTKNEILERPLFDLELVDEELSISDIKSVQSNKTYVLADNQHSFYNPTARDVLAYINTEKLKTYDDIGFMVNSIPEILYDDNIFSYQRFIHEGKVDLIKRKIK